MDGDFIIEVAEEGKDTTRLSPSELTTQTTYGSRMHRLSPFQDSLEATMPSTLSRHLRKKSVSVQNMEVGERILLDDLEQLFNCATVYAQDHHVLNPCDSLSHLFLTQGGKYLRQCRYIQRRTHVSRRFRVRVVITVSPTRRGILLSVFSLS